MAGPPGHFRRRRGVCHRRKGSPRPVAESHTQIGTSASEEGRVGTCYWRCALSGSLSAALVKLVTDRDAGAQ